MINHLILKSCLQKQLLLIFFLMLCLITNAQNIKPKYFAEAAIGSSFPTGNFANKNYTSGFRNNENGLAKIGIGLNLSVGYQLKKSYGTMLMFGYNQNKQDANSFDRYLKNTFGANTSTSVKTNNWQVFKIMGGGFFTTPFSPANKLLFKAKLLGGVCKTNIPGFKYFYSLFQGSAGSLFLAKVSLPWSFCYQVNAGLKYQLAQKIYLVSDISYFGSNPVYKYLYNPNPNQPAYLLSAEKKISVSSVQLSAGAGFYF